MAQAEWVARLLRSVHPGLSTTLVRVSTSGDRDPSTSLTTLSETGAFVRAVQVEVLEGRADLAVHSCKDLPVAGPPQLTVVYPGREAPWDVLCGTPLPDLPEGAVVGTGSPRRKAQLRQLRPDLRIRSIRGNVDSRLVASDYDAVVLAEAALHRLGRGNSLAHRFSLEEMVPAPAQGVLAVECCTGSEAASLVAAIDRIEVRRAVQAERTLLAVTGAGCRSALGAYAVLGSQIEMVAFVEDERGPRRGEVQADDPASAATSMQALLGL